MPMRYLTFANPEPSAFRACLLLPHIQLNDIERHYVIPHLEAHRHELLAYDLFKGPKQTKVAEQREYLAKLLPILRDLGVTHLVVGDAEYFKTLTRQGSADGSLGFVFDSVPLKEADMDGGIFRVSYVPNYRSVFYNPQKVEREIDIALKAVLADISGTYINPGIDIIKFAAYPDTIEGIRNWLERLLDMDRDLTGDIEAFSLKHYDAGIATISFSWSKHEGIAFPVDLLEYPADRLTVRFLLRQFFGEMHRRGRKLIWHNASFDVTVLISQLYMQDLLDTEGLLRGLEIFLDQFDDTQIITYLATNSCAGNRVGLKHQAQEFAGDWGLDDEDYKDIRKIPIADLLQYNLVDTLSTWFVLEKHWDTLVRDNQRDLYEGLFKDSLRDIIQMQLTGMPLDMERTIALDADFRAQSDSALYRIQSNPHVQRFVAHLNMEWVAMKNATLKKKRVSLLDAKETFNQNSTQQLQGLLYNPGQMNLPVLELTKTGQYATGAEVLEDLTHHTQDPDALALLEALIEYKSLDKLITSFLPHMLAAPKGPDGWHYLFGSFKLGGTVSGRLSSSNPNMQNIPSKGKTDLKIELAKKLKNCFKAPPGWLLCGLDFSSLEDMISALTTKDPNKIKVYTDGYDGHCLRAFGYFDDVMPDIDPNSVTSINSIKKKYPFERQESKVPTFLLTYGGTWRGIMRKLGWPEEKAQRIESKYHELYRVSDQWVADRIEEATHTGYVEVAFGLRLRTPLLKQVILKTRQTPFEAEAEGRTAGNALGQSWCLLNNRASAAFMKTVRASDYRLDIRPCAHIHDAQYHLVRDNMATLLFYNEHLVREVQWQDDPLIWHDEVKLGGEVSIFYPNWACELVIPNEASSSKIEELAFEHHQKYSEI